MGSTSCGASSYGSPPSRLRISCESGELSVTATLLWSGLGVVLRLAVSCRDYVWNVLLRLPGCQTIRGSPVSDPSI